MEIDAQVYAPAFRVNGVPAVGIGYMDPGASALDVATRVRAKMETLAKAFPPDIVYSVPFDTTKFVKASIDEV